VAPYALIELAVTGTGPLASSGGGNAAVRALFKLLSTTLIGPLISALHVRAVVAVAEGQTPRLGDVASTGARMLPVVAATEIIANLGIGVGLVALVVPGVLLLLRWSVAAQAAAVEREGWLPALRSSARLTSGHYGHVFTVVLIVAVVLAAKRRRDYPHSPARAHPGTRLSLGTNPFLVPKAPRMRPKSGISRLAPVDSHRQLPPANQTVLARISSRLVLHRTQEVAGSSPASSIGNRLEAGGFSLASSIAPALHRRRWSSFCQVAHRIAARSRADRRPRSPAIAAGSMITFRLSSGSSNAAKALALMRTRMSAACRASSKT